MILTLLLHINTSEKESAYTINHFATMMHIGRHTMSMHNTMKHIGCHIMSMHNTMTHIWREDFKTLKVVGGGSIMNDVYINSN